MATKLQASANKPVKKSKQSKNISDNKVSHETEIADQIFAKLSSSTVTEPETQAPTPGLDEKIENIYD